MGKKQTIIIVSIIAILCSCGGGRKVVRTIRSLEKDTMRLTVYKPGKNIPKDTVSIKAPQLISFKDKEGNDKIVIETSEEDRNQGVATTITLDEIKVVAKSRQVAERNGKVNIDFIISVPKEMLHKNWLVDIQPLLTKSGDSSTMQLDHILLYGKKFHKAQINGYTRYENFLRNIKGDSLDFLHNFTNWKLYGITLQRQQMRQNKLNRRLLARESGVSKDKSLLDNRFKRYNRFPIFSMEKRGIPGVKSEYNHLHYLGLSTKNDRLPVNWMIREVDTDNDSSLNPEEFGENTFKALSETDSLYWMDFYTRYGEIRRNEWLKDQKEERYAKYIKFPKDHTAKLDSVVDSGKEFRYYYSHDILVDENSRKLFLNVSGDVVNINGNSYKIPETDTITYFVSSMVQFADHAPRYRKKILERKAIANTYANIVFEKGATRIKEETGDNMAQLQRIQEISRELDESSEFILDSIIVTASSSPEGSWALNAVLAQKRSLSLASYFIDKQNEDKRLKDFVRAHSIPENWDYLKQLISGDNEIKYKNEILQLIDEEKHPDIRESRLRKEHPKDYAYIVNRLYPLLRSIHFSFNMHRRGMVKDTIQTTEIDAEYAEAIKKMEARKYKEALAILIEYNDRNTAICYMSMGYDDSALDILQKEPEGADNEYLMAILFSRKRNYDKAVKHYLRSVELDDSKAWRGALDPEINKLIEMYNLNEKVMQ